MDVNGERVTVDLGADGITVDGSAVDAVIELVEGTPLVLLNVNGTLHRLAVRREDARGRYAIWSDGYRFEVEGRLPLVGLLVRYEGWLERAA